MERRRVSSKAQHGATGRNEWTPGSLSQEIQAANEVPRVPLSLLELRHEPDTTAQGPRSTVNLADECCMSLMPSEHWQEAWAGMKESPMDKRGWHMSMKEETFPTAAVEYAGIQAPHNRGEYLWDAE